MNKKQAIAILIMVANTLLMSSLTIYRITKKEPEKTKQVETTIIIEPTTETTTETTTTTKKKTTKKKTTQKIVFNANASQKEMMDYALEQVIAKGWLKSEYEAVVSIVARESSWNPNSVNRSSGACGLFQAYPCSKAIKEYPDYMTNYKSQIDWGLNYIKDRYKTPSNAWKFWQEHKWY